MLTFPNITPAVFQRVLDELREHSTVTEQKILGRPSYRVVGGGIDALVELNGPTGDVQVKIASKPFYVSEGMIRGKIQDAIEKAQGESPKNA